MGFLDSFERQVERLVGGAFAKTFTSGVHPVEIVAALKKEMDATSRSITRSRVLAPYLFHVGLSSSDFQRLGKLGPEFVSEIRQTLEDYRMLRGYSCQEPVAIRLEEKLTLAEGMVDVRSDRAGSVVWVPTLTWNSVRYPLTRKSTILGRGTDSDVHVVTPGVSRHHAEIRWNGKRCEVVDLGSTNGTTLDGEKVSRAALPDSCTLGVGRARILFQVVPLSSAAYDALAHTPLNSAEETS